MTRPTRWVMAAGLAGVFASAVARADVPTPTEPTATTVTRPAGSLGADVPRGAVERFLGACRHNDYTSAAERLDLRKVPRAVRAERGPLLARQLEAVLERNVTIDVALLSDAPEGERDDDLPPNRDLLAIVDTEHGAVEVLLDRITTPDGTATWKVAGDTVARIPDLYTELGYGPFADRLPTPLVTLRFLGIRLWQWIGLGLVILAGIAVSWLTSRLVSQVGSRLLTRLGLDVRYATSIAGPIRLLVAIAVTVAALPFLAFALAPLRVLLGIQQALAIIACTWMVLRAIDVLSTRAQRRFVQHRQLGAVSMVPLGRRMLKIAVAGLAIVTALQNFGFNVTGIAAGLGIGGLAIALAAQKTVENLFGGVSLIADQPVRVGDFCRFGETQGMVEDIGLRSTRIRTLDRTVVTIPNAQFSALPLENLSRRDRILARATLVLRSNLGAERVRDILTQLRTMLAAQPKVEGPSARATLVHLGPQIEIEIFAYILTTSWHEYLEHREQMFLGALDAVGEDALFVK